MTADSSLQALIRETEARFEAEFQRRPQWVVAAPGRVNLIGEHTDYNDGFVFPMAIDRHVVIAADRRVPQSNNGAQARVFSMTVDEWADVRVQPPIEPGASSWASYIQGTVAGCLEHGLQPDAFAAVVHSDVPLGGGLSSSAALEVATATLVEAMTQQTLELREKILLCQKAEHVYAGMPCGIMDQFSSVMGEQDCLMLLDCRAQQAENVRLPDPGVAVLIANTNVKHELTGSEYPERRAQCEAAARQLGVPALRDATLEKLEADGGGMEPVQYRRARHVVSEIARTLSAAEAIRAAQWDTVGQLMYASHDSLRDDYEVSCGELDLLVELAKGIGESGGVIGSRMTGGGFGGCTVSLIRAEKAEQIAASLREDYQKKTGIEPTVFVSRPSQGARIVRNGNSGGS